MKHAFTSLLVAAMLVTATGRILAQSDAVKPDTGAAQPDRAFAELEGDWVHEKILTAGKTIPDEKFPYEYHFRAPDKLIRKGITVGSVTGRGGEDKITLDSSKKPAIMNITRSERGKTQTVLAIYKVEDDLLTLCVLRDADGRPSSARPKVFESNAETRSDLIVLKRKPKPKQ
jgi:uncharacterized protein (TIGR03067 family)